MSGGIDALHVMMGSRRIDHHTHPGPRGLDARFVADADEDEVTLAVAVLRRYLDASGHTINDIDRVLIASRIDPSGHAVIAEALGAPRLDMVPFPGTTEGAMHALEWAAKSGTHQLVVAVSDGRDEPSEHAGAAAALAAVTPEGSLTVTSSAACRQTTHDTGTMIRATLERLEGVSADNGMIAPAMQTPQDQRAWFGRAFEWTIAAPPVATTGALGAAAPLVALTYATEPTAEKDIVLVDAGTDGCHAMRFTGPAPATIDRPQLDAASTASDIDPQAARRARDAWQAGGMTAQGAFVSMQAYQGQAAARYRMVGQRCDACDAVVFPPREGCPACAATDLTPLPLSRKGSVYARTRIGTGGAPTEFSPLQEATGPYGVAIVALEEGPRVAAMCTHAARELAIGAAVTMELRLLYVQDGQARYGFKAHPAR